MRKKIETLISTDINQALYFLNNNECIGMPTETVYGLAADATSDIAVQKIYQAKGRPSFNPLIIHVTDLKMAQEWGYFNDMALRLANAFWQCDSTFNNSKPLTLVVPLKNKMLSKYVTAGLETVGIRVPAHPMAQQLIKEFSIPLAAPSANRSNYISPTTAKSVYDDLNGLIPFILDGGPCQMGLESTIVDATNNTPLILRYGSTLKEDIVKICPHMSMNEPNLHNPNHHQIIAPGMLKKHYSPKIPVRLNVTIPHDNEAFLAFGPKYDHLETLNLSKSGSLEEAAFNLYAMLRALDQNQYTSIAIAPIPSTGIGAAINDRLQRAMG